MLTKCVYTTPSDADPIPCTNWAQRDTWYDVPLCWQHNPNGRFLRRRKAQREEVLARLADMIQAATRTQQQRERHTAQRRRLAV